MSNRSRFALVGAGVMLVALVATCLISCSRAPSPRAPSEGVKAAVAAAEGLEAKLEIGINHDEYFSQLGDLWGKVKPLTYSPHPQDAPIVDALSNAMDCWTAASKDWQASFEYSYHIPSDIDRQAQWRKAAVWVKCARERLSGLTSTPQPQLDAISQELEHLLAQEKARVGAIDAR